MTNLNDVMTVAEVAEMYDLEPSGIRAAIKRGAIDGRKSGGTWLVLRADVEVRWGQDKAQNANTRTNQIAELDELLRGVILPSLPHSADCEGMSAESIADLTLEWWYEQAPVLPEWFGDADREYLRDQLVEEIEYAG